MTKGIVIIGNPTAGGGVLPNIERAVAILKRKGYGVQLLLTSKRGDAERFARDASDRPDTLVVAAGGDGTYNEVANGLALSKTPMAILPLGTTCVLARELRVPRDLERALDFALRGRVEQIHLGRITLNSPGPASDREERSAAIRITRHFLLMAGIGFDGETVFRIDERIKRHTGKGAYILSGIGTLMRYDPSPITLEALLDDEGRDRISRISTTGGSVREVHEGDSPRSLRIEAYAAIVGKGSCYGGDFRITPDARLTDPHFYVFLTHRKGRFNLLGYALRIITGRHLTCCDVSYFRARHVSVHGKAHVQIDGDYAGTIPAEIDVVPEALHMVTRLE